MPACKHRDRTKKIPCVMSQSKFSVRSLAILFGLHVAIILVGFSTQMTIRACTEPISHVMTFVTFDNIKIREKIYPG